MLTVKHILEFVLMIILYRSFEIAGVKKYAVAIILCLILLLVSRKKRWSVEAMCIAIPASVYIVFGSVAGIFHGSYQFDAVKIIMFGMLAFVLALSMYVYYGEDMSRMIDVQFFSCCTVYLSLTIVYMVTRFARVESTFAFLFGLFTIYYAYKRRWKTLAVSVVFTYLADKRIVLLAIVASIVIMAVLRFFENNRKLVHAVWAVVTGFVYLYLYLIYSGIMDAFCWGANINTNGRVEMYSRMANEFHFSPTFLGEGLGKVENMLAFWNVEKFANLHNDLLKFYIELGFLGLLVYMLSYCVMFQLIGKRFGNSKMCFVLGVSVYSMFLYATDNVSIYVMYLLPMYSICFAALSPGTMQHLKEKETYDQKVIE